MPTYSFGRNDILYNRIEAHPFCEFVLYSGSVYLNNLSSSWDQGIIRNGHVSLHEINTGRNPDDHTWNPVLETGKEALIYPFVTKDGSMDAFATVSQTNFRFGGYGDVITGSYPLTASISIKHVATGSTSTNRKYLNALRNSIDFSRTRSPRFNWTAPYGGGYSNCRARIVDIPSIFYGSSLQRGTVRLKFYLTGALIAEAHDKDKNGELIQVSGAVTGGCIGTVLYDEGFILLTGSSTIKTTGDDYNIAEIATDGTTPSADNNFKWIYWGEMGTKPVPPDQSDTELPWATGDASVSDRGAIQSSSYSLEFRGTTRIPVLTMLAHAPKGQLNHSNNFSYIRSGSQIVQASGSVDYIENKYTEIKNTMSSSYTRHSASFEKQTFISSIKIYDENHECIAIAKLAKPIKKSEERGYTFKLKLDV